jgi:hypothetical protein
VLVQPWLVLVQLLLLLLRLLLHPLLWVLVLLQPLLLHLVLCLPCCPLHRRCPLLGQRSQYYLVLTALLLPCL